MVNTKSRACKLLLWLGILVAGITLVAQDSPVAPEPVADQPENQDLAESPVPAENTTESETQPARSIPLPELLTPSERAAKVRSADGKIHVYRVPITDEISKPNLYILRRSVKQAIEQDVKVLLIDMDTPGGRLDVTLDMMELLEHFDGDTITYVNKDAVSAGSYISMATDSIYFSPDGVMGAAAVVSGSGGDIDDTMKAKINSYLLARMRSYTHQFPYRSEVIRAMADQDYELKIDGQVIKPSGELLSLTAQEAVTAYGNPPRPLLADGIAGSLEEVLADRYGEGTSVVETFRISWSEELAKYLDSIAPILLGLGLLLLFIEFKTPGFGLFGISGLVLVALVFASNYLAGLAGFEPILFFFLGLVLIVVDIFLLPGTFLFLVIGFVFVIGSLLWSLSDIWPLPEGEGTPGVPFTVDPNSVWAALYQILAAFAIALGGLWLVWRFLPRTPIYRHLVHSMAGAMPDPVLTGGGDVRGIGALPVVGSKGVVATPLHPLGEVIIAGQRYQATVAIGTLDKDTPVVVIGYKHFNLLVESTENT